LLGDGSSKKLCFGQINDFLDKMWQEAVGIETREYSWEIRKNSGDIFFYRND